MKCIVELFGDDRNGRKMIAWGRRIGCTDAGHVFDAERRKVATRLLVDDANIDNAVKYAVKAEIKKGLVLGGPTLVSDASVRAIFSMSEDDEIKVID